MSNSYDSITFGGAGSSNVDASNQAYRDANAQTVSDLHGPTHILGPLTIICRADQMDMYARFKNPSSRSYPKGFGAASLSVYENEAVIGYKRTRKGGLEYTIGFSSLNGLPFGEAETVEDLENKFYFIGLSRSDYHTIDDASKNMRAHRSGFAVAVFGFTSVRQKWPTDIYPGDKIMWSFPSLEDAVQSSKSMSTSRHPRDKLMVQLHPLDWSHLHYAINNVCQIFLRKGNDIGISKNLGFGNGEYSTSKSKANSSNKAKAAQGMKTHCLITVAKGVEVLNNRNIIKVMTPYETKKEQTKDALIVALMNALITMSNADGGDAFDGMTISGNAPSFGTTTIPEYLSVQETYREYVDALRSPKTNVIKGTNVTYPGENDQFTKNYTFFTQGAHLASSSVYDRPPLENADDAAAYLRDKQMEKVNETLFIADALGLIDTPSGQADSQELIHDLVNATHLGYAEPESKRKYATGRSIKNISERLSRQESAALKEYQRVAENHVFDNNEAMSMFTASIEDKVVGTAFSYAPAGQLSTVLDIALKVK